MTVGGMGFIPERLLMMMMMMINNNWGYFNVREPTRTHLPHEHTRATSLMSLCVPISPMSLCVSTSPMSLD